MNIKNILNSTVRRYLYGVAIAFVPVAIWLGWLAPEAAPIVIPLIVAIFNVPSDKAEEISPQTPEARG